MDRIRSSRWVWLSLLCLSPVACGDGDAERSEQATAAETPRPEAARSEITEQDLHEFRLTMDGIHAWFDATAAITRAVHEDPSLADRLSAGQGDEEGADTPAAEIARFESEPRMVEVLRSAGLSPREYVLTGMTFIQASFAVAVLEQDPTFKPPAAVHPDHIEVVRANKAEIERLGRAMQAQESGG